MIPDKPILKLMLAALMISGVISCATDNGSVKIDPGQVDIVLSGTNPKTVSFKASSEWYARVFYEKGDTVKWLNVSPLSGEQGDRSVTLTAKSANYTQRDRHADVEIKLPGNAGARIKVTQPNVEKPRKVKSITRAMAGGILSGPAEITFKYNTETQELASFTAGGVNGVTYSLGGEGSSGTIIMKNRNGESSLPVKMLDGRITGYDNIQWSFADNNTGIILDVSTVSFSFGYDTGEDKLLNSIVRNETVTISNGETVNPPVSTRETFNYIYDNIRIDSIVYIKTYHPDLQEQVSDTLEYKLKYHTEENNIQENNLSANLWNILVLPQAQGTPFYSFTGFWLLGLTSEIQSHFPESADIIATIHSAEGQASTWPSKYLYTYQRSGEELDETSAIITFPAITGNVTSTFSYYNNEEGYVDEVTE